MSCGKSGVRHVISAVCAEMGFPTRDGQDSFHELLPEAETELGERSREYLDPMEAGAEIRAVLRSLPENGKPSNHILSIRDKIMDGVETGRIRITRAEMLALSRMPAHVHVDQALGTGEGDEEYRALVEQRNCEICGQFIGRRVGHINCAKKGMAGNIEERAYGYGGYGAALHRIDLKPGENVHEIARWDAVSTDDPESSNAPNLPTFAVVYDRRDGSWEDRQLRRAVGRGDKLVDTYFAVPNDTREGINARDAAIYSTMTYKMFGGLTCKAPREIALGIVDDPTQVSQRGLFTLAQFGRDEYTGSQVRRMIALSGEHAAKPLLAAPRTRKKALDVLHDPEHAQLKRDLAKGGYLPGTDVIALASSPIPTDREAAAVSPNLPHQERVRLARDETSVAGVMARSPQVMRADPEAFRVLLSHPDIVVRGRAADTAIDSDDPVLKAEAREVRLTMGR